VIAPAPARSPRQGPPATVHSRDPRTTRPICRLSLNSRIAATFREEGRIDGVDEGAQVGDRSRGGGGGGSDAVRRVAHGLVDRPRKAERTGQQRGEDARARRLGSSGDIGETHRATDPSEGRVKPRVDCVITYGGSAGAVPADQKRPP